MLVCDMLLLKESGSNANCFLTSSFVYHSQNRPVIIAFGVPLIATETFLCLSESFLCHLQHTKSPHKISEGKRYYNTLIYSSYNTFCGGPVSPPLIVLSLPRKRFRLYRRLE